MKFNILFILALISGSFIKTAETLMDHLENPVPLLFPLENSKILIEENLQIGNLDNFKIKITFVDPEDFKSDIIEANKYYVQILNDMNHEIAAVDIKTFKIDKIENLIAYGILERIWVSDIYRETGIGEFIFNKIEEILRLKNIRVLFWKLLPFDSGKKGKKDIDSLIEWYRKRGGRILIRDKDAVIMMSGKLDQMIRSKL